MWYVCMCAVLCVCVSHLVVYDSLWHPPPPPWTVGCQAPQAMEFSRWESGVGCHSLLRGIFPTQESNPCLPHCRQILCCLSHLVYSHKKWNVQSACRTSESNKILYLNSIWIKIKLAMLLLYIVMFLTLDTNNLQSNHEMPEVKDFDFCKVVFLATLSQLMPR